MVSNVLALLLPVSFLLGVMTPTFLVMDPL